MTTNFLELATTLKYLGAKLLPGKKLILHPAILLSLLGTYNCYFLQCDCSAVNDLIFFFLMLPYALIAP